MLHSGNNGWAEVSGHRTVKPYTKKVGRRCIATAIGVLLLMILGEILASADCATGGDCAIASGEWFQQLAKK